MVLDRQYRGWETELIADLKTIYRSGKIGRFSGRCPGLRKYDRLLRQQQRKSMRSPLGRLRGARSAVPRQPVIRRVHSSLGILKELLD
ncbi:MAG: hypothetical protein GDA48_25160 [Hormoscilla sp. GM102CHS1]|nr:hypothetical protein [Hormoscilla sp. GM102CHS1]